MGRERGVREIRLVDPKIQNNRTAEEKYMENIRKVNIENLFGARSVRAPADTLPSPQNALHVPCSPARRPEVGSELGVMLTQPLMMYTTIPTGHQDDPPTANSAPQRH